MIFGEKITQEKQKESVCRRAGLYVPPFLFVGTGVCIRFRIVQRLRPESEPIFAPKRNRVLRASGANVAEPARGACAAWF